MEDVKVTIKDALWLGLCFGLGLGLALIFYAIIALSIAMALGHVVLN